jgi:hypothetical protein
MGMWSAATPRQSPSSLVFIHCLGSVSAKTALHNDTAAEPPLGWMVVGEDGRSCTALSRQLSTRSRVSWWRRWRRWRGRHPKVGESVSEIRNCRALAENKFCALHAEPGAAAALGRKGGRRRAVSNDPEPDTSLAVELPKTAVGDVYGFWSVQQREGSATGCHVSILRRTQRRKVADGHGVDDNPEEERVNCSWGDVGYVPVAGSPSPEMCFLTTDVLAGCGRYS